MQLTNALWITLIGMSLVFVAILLLWGLMALLVRVTADKVVDETPAEAPAAVSEAAPEAPLAAARKRKAAAAAAAYALAVQAARPSRTTGEPQAAGTLSPWQAVNRAGRLSQQIVTSKKKVVR